MPRRKTAAEVSRGRIEAVAIFGTFLMATFAFVTCLLLDVEMGNANQQIRQLQSRVIRLEHSRLQPRIRLTASTCPYGDTCVTGKLLVRDPGSDTPHQLLVEDKSGAPMFWVDYGGAWSGGEPVCVTDLHLRPVACLGGAHGSYGGEPVVALWDGHRWQVLSAGDVAWMHRAEKVIGRLLYVHHR